MNRYERFVADFFLAAYNTEMPFAEILFHLEENSDLILPFEPFINMNPQTLVGLMEDMLVDLMNNFNPKTIRENDLEGMFNED